MLNKPHQVLLIEDNPGDVNLVRETFSKYNFDIHLEIVSDGADAINYLQKLGRYQKATRPDLILLDLNLPGKDGRELLYAMKNHFDLKAIPVVVFTTSDADTDIVRAYELGANCYVTKPIDFTRFSKSLKDILNFWLRRVQLPVDPAHISWNQAGPEKFSRTFDRAELAALIIEDNRADAEYLEILFSGIQEPTFRTQWCATLESGIDFLATERVDLIFLDLGLPGTGGLETLKKVRVKVPFVPIVILTGLNDHSVAASALRSGAQDYLVKDEVNSVLLSRVARYAIERMWTEVERASLLEQEKKARAEAEKALAARDEFLAVASHELKTPISALIMQNRLVNQYVDQFESETPNLAKIKTLVEQTEHQARRLSKTVENLLDISKIQAGKLNIEPEAVNISELLTNLTQRLGAQFEHSHCRIVLHLPPTPIHGTWDRFRIEQVMTNLMSNAMKYGSGKPVEISLSCERDTVRIDIRDQGIGISLEDQKKLFSKYERAASVTKQFAGTGLGLYIANQIVKAHGGELTLASRPGAGSTFTVQLPQKYSWEIAATG